MCEYAIHFRTLAAESGWNSAALYDAFFKGLAHSISERLLPLDLPPDLDSLIALAIRTDNQLEEFKALRAPTVRFNRPQSAVLWTPHPGSPPEQPRRATPTPDTEEPMQMGRARLPPEEQQRRVRGGLCFYCGEARHLVAACPEKYTRAGRPFSAPSTPAQLLTPVQVKHNTVQLSLEALIDSGADESLLDWGLAKQLGLETQCLDNAIKASSLNGRELFTITHVTEPVTVSIENHTEQITFFLFRSHTHTLVLGHPWLIKHNPRLDWPTGWVTEWCRECVGRCPSAFPQCAHTILTLSLLTPPQTPYTRT